MLEGKPMTDYTIKTETLHINVSPISFRHTARDLFKCYLVFEKPDWFSVVPYFLCCRAIELALKAIHLETKRQLDVKNEYWHNLVALYSGLPREKQTLSDEEFKHLEQVSCIYNEKRLEYVSVSDLGTGYQRFPNLDALAQLARKITEYGA